MKKTILLLLVLIAGTTAAHAEFYGIGSAQQGSTTYRLATALATEFSLQSGEQFRSEPHVSTFAAVPLINDGELDFGLGNAIEISNSFHGDGVAAGRPAPNLRVVATLFPFRIAYVVRKDGDIKSFKDLPGKRIPSGFDAQPTVAVIASSLFDNTGLADGDVNLLPVLNATQAREDLTNDRLDAAVAVIGSGSLKRMDHAMGGLRCLSLNTEGAAIKRLTTRIPVTTAHLDPESGLTCVNEPIDVISYNYFIYAHGGLDEAAVYRVAEMLYRSKEKLAGYIPAFRNFDPLAMNPDIGVPYHPGAEKFYRERGKLQ